MVRQRPHRNDRPPRVALETVIIAALIAVAVLSGLSAVGTDLKPIYIDMSRPARG